ncbi:unnamed protein product [Caenorhabditis brenneri]
MAAIISINFLELKSLTVDQDLYTYTDGDVVQSAQKAFEYLNELFSCPLTSISVSTGYIRKSKRPFFFGMRECTELIVNGKNKILIKKDFKFNIATIKHPEVIWIPYCAHWVTSKMIFKLNCSYLLLHDTKWTAKDCESFVARWLNSDDTFFCFLKLYWIERVPADLNFENLGVELIKFDPETRDPDYPCSDSHLAFDVSTGRDFIRKDGLMATIAVSEHTFIFCVWHKRHQNMNGVTITHRLT